MQPIYPQNSRQRPLQKSMFLPQSEQYLNRPGQMDYQYQDIMKRSFINPDTTKFNSFQFNQPNIQPQTPIHHSNTNSNLVLNFNSNTRYKQTAKQIQFQQLPQTSVNSDLVIQQIQEKVNQLSQIIENHDEILKKNNLICTNDKNSITTQLSQIENKIKQSILPTMISRQTKEIYQHIFNFKLQIKSLKEEVTEISEKIQQEIMILNENNKSIPTVNPIQKHDKCENLFANLGANLMSLENKFVEMQREFKSQFQDIKNLVLEQMKKGRKEEQEIKMSTPKLISSKIQSTLCPIMIEYREIFGIKNQNQQNTDVSRKVISSPPSDYEKQILINLTTYFIDRQGYLLDNQNRYIVDLKGHQIKLDQNHLTLLKQSHVLN